MSGFSFKGFSLSEYGVHYAPERENWPIWDSTYETTEKEVASQDGGQWFGARVKPKKFALRCYFEDLSEQALALALGLFDMGSQGKLAFDERPWLEYDAVVTAPSMLTKIPVSPHRLSGWVVFNLTAYYPYATAKIESLDEAEDFYDLYPRLLGTTGFVYEEGQPVNTEITVAAKATSQFYYYVYNAGDAPASTTIAISGDVGDGIIIHNAQTKQECVVFGLTSALSTNVGKWLEMKSWTGEVAQTDGFNRENGFIYHDKAFIEISPSHPIKRDATFAHAGVEIYSDKPVFWSNDVGKYIQTEVGWTQITGFVNPKLVYVEAHQGGRVEQSGHVISQNRIVVTPIGSMSLDRFEVDYKSTFK